MLANTFDVPREEVESWTPYAGGAPCNVSTALAKLGVKSSFASAVGKDDMGNNLMNILKGKWIVPCSGVFLLANNAVLKISFRLLHYRLRS